MGEEGLEVKSDSSMMPDRVLQSNGLKGSGFGERRQPQSFGSGV